MLYEAELTSFSVYSMLVRIYTKDSKSVNCITTVNISGSIDMAKGILWR